MSKAKHTPGPWSSDGSGDITHQDKQPIAFVNWTAYAEGEANARLIAAAPDLLSACEFVLAHAFERKWDEDGRAFTMISSALRKANGGTA